EVINEIQAAVAVGKEVIVHQGNITAFGWTGAGYVVFDPVTGDGAWRISGGGNGAALVAGFVVGFDLIGLALISDVMYRSKGILSSQLIIFATILLIRITAMILLVKALQKAEKHNPPEQQKHVLDCFMFGFIASGVFFAFEMFKITKNPFSPALQASISVIFGILGVSSLTGIASGAGNCANYLGV
ncbi:MAG: hypothetical protein R8L53_10135, partial [Mariprofundales bacterium]